MSKHIFIAPDKGQARSKKSVALYSIFAVLAMLFLWMVLAESGTPYTVLERTEGTGQVTYLIQVPKGTSLETMHRWAKELAEKSDKETMVNFYDGPRSLENFTASYQGGTTYDSRSGNSASQ